MEIGDYFNVVSLADHVMYVEMKGFWSDDVARQLGRDFTSAFRRAVDEISADGPFVGLADLSELSVLSHESKTLLSQAMGYSNDHGVYKVIEVIPRAITSLSIREAAEMTGQDDFRVVVKSLDEALPIVDELVKQLHGVRPTSLVELTVAEQ